jgi:ABC-2 type transport system ATP-binding protein
MLSVKNISKSFGNIKAVDDISFTVNEGEIVGLLGPNGAGKTTSMRVMTGFLSPDKGDVQIGGFSILENPIECRKLIGYLPENNPLYKDMLVSDFLEFSAELKNLSGKKKKDAFDFVVSATGIKDIFYRTILELSKGYKQRVGLAAVLLHRPKFLILDEPSEGLDPNQRTEIRKLIKDLAREHTVVVSTHVMQEAEALCDRMVVMNKGKVVADGSVSEISSGIKNEKIIEAEIEGSAVRTSLSRLKVKDMDIKEKKGNLYSVKIIADPKTSIQPEISKLSHEKKWIIWKIEEKTQHLEDVFRKLTEEI